MSLPSDKDLLGKADALLRRHAVAAPRNGSETGGVPVLTDLVGGPQPDPEAPAPEAGSELAQQVFTRVMREVEQRLASDLERRLIEHLVPQVHAAVGTALDGLRGEIADAVEEAVAQALERRPVK